MSLRIDVSFRGSDVVADLDRIADELPGAIQKGVGKATKAIFNEAFDLLSGPKGEPGDYPVPIVTGHLRRLLDFLDPGGSKTKNGMSVTAGEYEGIVFDSARYSDVIREGTHSSGAYGDRDFISDGAEAFGGSEKVKEFLLTEIDTVMER